MGGGVGICGREPFQREVRARAPRRDWSRCTTRETCSRASRRGSGRASRRRRVDWGARSSVAWSVAPPESPPCQHSHHGRDHDAGPTVVEALGDPVANHHFGGDAQSDYSLKDDGYKAARTPDGSRIAPTLRHRACGGASELCSAPSDALSREDIMSDDAPSRRELPRPDDERHAQYGRCVSCSWSPKRSSRVVHPQLLPWPLAVEFGRVHRMEGVRLLAGAQGMGSSRAVTLKTS